jgi:hypothetical protein
MANVGSRGIAPSSHCHRRSLEAPKVRGLADEGGAVYLAQGGKEIGVVVPEVGEERAVLLQSQLFPNNLHRHDLTIGQGGRWPPLPESVPIHRLGNGLVDPTKHSDKGVIQVHRSTLLRLFATVPEDTKPMGPGLRHAEKPAHRDTRCTA